MKGKKILIAVICAIAGTGVLGAFDYGFELSNKGGIQNSGTFDWYTDHKETLWFSIPFDPANMNFLAAEGSLYASKKANERTFRFYPDLDLFRLSFTPVSVTGFKLSMDMGRINASDVTGLILSQKIDGFELHGSLPFANIDFLAGYTGLLNARKGMNLMTSDDNADYNSTTPYVLGASRAVGKVAFQIPQLIGTTDFVIEGTGQYDLRRFVKPSYNQLVDTAYGTVSFNGPLTNTLFYSLSGTYQAGLLTQTSSNYSENSILASLRFDVFPFSGNHLFAQFVYTPPRSAFFSDYLPVTFQSAGTLYTKGYGNLMKASAGWFFNPLEMLNLDFGGNVFFNATESTAGAGLYNSAELTGGATLKITNDLRFRLDSIFYFPNSASMQYQAAMKAILEL